MTPILQTILIAAGTLSAPIAAQTPSCGTTWKAQDLSVAISPKGHLVAIRGLDGYLKTMEWDSATGKWSDWSPPPAQQLSYGAPWLQAPVNVAGVGSTNNLFALSKTEGAARVSQWTRDSSGAFQTTIGIGTADSILFRPVCAHMGPSGQQALFAVFRDSTLMMRVWDSLGREWGPWSSMGVKTTHAPTANQVGPNDVNVYVRLADGSVDQNWWAAGSWSGWVVPAYSGAASELSSVNINWADHLLFSFDSIGKPQVRYWNGSSWTGWSRLTFPVQRQLAPVVVGTDSVLLYGLDSSDQIVRIGWKKNVGWGVPDTLGQTPCKPQRPIDNRILSTTRVTDGVLLAIRGLNDSIYTLLLRSGQDSSRCWSALSGQPRILSNPWLQAAVGGVNNLYVLGESDGAPRTFQWIYDNGTFQTTIGIGESDSVVSLAGGRLDDTGHQALFALFQDSSVRMRVWDSLGNTWGGWSQLGQKSTRSLDVVQVTPSQLNLYAIGTDGHVNQRWWRESDWSSWVVPSYDSIVSGASSANFDDLNHVLFGIGPDSTLVERTWNGATWTAWHNLPWKPRGEVAPVMVDSVLQLYFTTADGSIRVASRTLQSSWSEASFVARIPPSATCSVAPNPVTAKIKTPRVAVQHHGLLALPAELVSYEGPVLFVGLDGKSARTMKAKGVREIAVQGQGIGFVKLGSSTLRVLQVR